MDTPDTYTQQHAVGAVAVAVTRHAVALPAEFSVPYEGADPLVRAAFPAGFSPSYGSGIAFKERDADGALLFYCLTDRGPNGDGPRVPAPAGTGHMDTKLYPAPGFTPAIGLLRVDDAGAVLCASQPIQVAEGVSASGLPLPPGAAGNSAEVPLLDKLQFDPDGKAVFHAAGIDSEAIAYDPGAGVLWVTDEYGPFLLKIDAATGVVIERYAPGAGLPPILAKRRVNRGMEGMTLDSSTGHIHAFLQSPLSDGGKEIERHARFLRWVEFDPASERTLRMLAYPLDPAVFADGRTGNAKLGDLVALGDGRFVVIEQGEGADGAMFNHLVLVDIAGATDIGAARFSPDSSALEQSSIIGTAVDGAQWSEVTPLKKTLLLDLNAIGWHAEKAEGLALVDARTLAMTNDSDFGMKTRVYAANGDEVALDVTEWNVDAAGALPAAYAGHSVRVARAAPEDGVLSIWMLAFDRPLLDYRA